MNKEKIIHTLEQYDFKNGANEFPLMVVISLVYICNARCPNCPYNNSDIRKSYKDAMIMPAKIFKRIADECGKNFASISNIKGKS